MKLRFEASPAEVEAYGAEAALELLRAVADADDRAQSARDALEKALTENDPLDDQRSLRADVVRKLHQRMGAVYQRELRKLEKDLQKIVESAGRGGDASSR